MKRWRRPLILITLLLLAGAVVNVAVAWWIIAADNRGVRQAIEHPVPTFHIAPTRLGPEHPFAHATLFAARWQPVSALSGGLWQLEECHSYYPPVAHEDYIREEWRGTSASGFPVLAMRLSYKRGSLRREPAPVEGLLGGVAAPESWVRRGRFATTGGHVPLAPIPAGFAINTLFYAAILALPLSFIPIRRRLRARRGRCPKCGYDLAGLAARKDAASATPCPECGATR